MLINCPGMGISTFFQYIANWKETCYDGPVSLDLYLQDYEEVAPQCLEYINREVFSKL